MATIRDATPADAGAIAAVQVASWRAAYRGLLPDEVLAGLSVPGLTQMWTGRFAASPPRSSVVVACAGEAIVGFASGGPPESPDDRADPNLADVYTLYLDPAHWDRGIGAQLHDAVLARLAGHGFTHAGLWVLAGNERALRFYLRNGWTDTGRTQVDRGPQGVELHERRLQRDLDAG